MDTDQLSRADQLLSTAYHEAGHAVAAVRFRLRLRSVSIVPDESAGSIGHAVHENLTGFNPDSDHSWKTRSRCEHIAILSLAGHIAAYDAGCDEDDLEWEGDRAAALEMINSMSTTEEEAQAYLAWLTIRAQQFVAEERNWYAISSVAIGLLMSHTLSGHRVRQIVRQADRESEERSARESPNSIPDENEP